MTLLAPAALWLSMIAAAVVALYILKIKRRRQPVPALDFWRQLAGQTQMRSLFQRLKRWLSLALWLLIVACLVLSVGNPVFSFGRIKPQSIAVIVDNSASMQTREPVEGAEPRTRLSMAVDAVRELTGRRPVSDEWMLIEAGREPRVLAPWTMDRRQICDAAALVTPHLGSANLSAAKELAGQLLAGKERPCVVVVSDGAGGTAPQPAAGGTPIVYWPIGVTKDNLGIARLRVRTHRDQAAHFAYVSVVNASSDRIETQLVFEIDGSTVAVEPIAVEGGASWDKTLMLTAPQGGVLRVHIDRSDALPTDNEAFAVLEPITRASVLLVTAPDEAFFFQQALAAMESLVDADTSHTTTLEDYETADPASLHHDLVVFNNCSPKKWPASGPQVFINAWPQDMPVKSSGSIEHPEITLAQRNHPLCRYVNPGVVALARAHRTDLLDKATVLATTPDGAPLIWLFEQPGRSALGLSFDVMESDLPFRNAFPMFLRNAVAYLVGQQAAPILDQYRIGDTIEPTRPLAPEIKQVEVSGMRKDDPAHLTLPVQDGMFLFDRTGEPGPLRFSLGDDTAYAAVNLADAAESRIAPTPAEKKPEEQLALTGRLLGTVPWAALAALGAMLIGLEWLTYHHRWTE